MPHPVRSFAPNGNSLAVAQIRALRRAAAIALVAVAFLSLHLALDHGAAVASRADQAARQPRAAATDTAPFQKIGL